ncbi:IS1/IS1595 family N-terminal zinc-binding domain-containing protein [Spiroplasma endosymbiont of 'Nebria riversi']|uniref:IS1/IS1595 family N-terminal zinc-binding domain-containing protein n=1 Tax=Spiroplasma endosymbiont of 'Nebria riversi' TaxID=2792084 RepID=UPI003F7949FE
MIKKQKRLNEIDQKFRAQGIKCPKCESYHCVKNGHNSEGKQKYLCKNCRASFDAFRNHFIYWSHFFILSRVLYKIKKIFRFNE